MCLGRAKFKQEQEIRGMNPIKGRVQQEMEESCHYRCENEVAAVLAKLGRSTGDCTRIVIFW